MLLDSRPDVLYLKKRQTFHMSCSDELVRVYKPDIYGTIFGVALRPGDPSLWLFRSTLGSNLLGFYQDL